MTSAPLASTSQLSHVVDSAPPTILSLAHSLSTSINATFDRVSSSSSTPSSSTRFLHPYGPLDPQQLNRTRQHVSTTLTQLRQAIQSFNSLLPPPPTPTSDHSTSNQATVAPTAASNMKPHAQLDKYLTVLKEASTHQGALHHWLSTELDIAKRVVDAHTNEESVPVAIPNELGLIGLERTVQVLQGIAKGFGLVSFREGGQEEGEKSAMTMPRAETETLSLGGKVMVVDFIISTKRGNVDKVNVSYVMDAGQVDLTEVAGSLQKCVSLLGDEEARAHEEGGAEALQGGLRGCRRILRELTSLDTMTEQSGVDAFLAVERIEMACRLVLSPGQAEGQPCSETTPKPVDPTRRGLLLPRTRDHLPRILYHATPLVQMTNTWTQASTSNFEQDLSDLLSLDGISTLSIHLEKPNKSTLIPSSYVDLVEEETQGDSTTTMFDPPAAKKVRYRVLDKGTAPWFVAKFDGGVGITKEVGRRLREVLGEVGVGVGSGNGKGMERKGREGVCMLDAVLLSQRPMERVDAVYPTARYKVSFDDLPMVQEYALDSSTRVPGYLLTSLRFQEPEHLFKALKIIQAQARINALVRSVFHPRYLVPRSGMKNGVLDGGLPTKRRKLEVEVPISLEDVLESPRSTLPIFVQIQNDSSISLSFPHPSGPAELAKPTALHISSTSSEEGEEGYHLRFEGLEVDVSKAKEVLDLTGDLGLLMRWAMKTLG
ncbi:BZ3500_MvSof-1268-A1-R1_Chr10-2g02978 [Microbotryum saponariae]|uniref:BZ3500_MvSof-1268-A1-R1_Chr10-2g02978 protein n=1 Tax=Microbotryum saponariae TaxID=289078 RepID=A0A2X0N440_9BASI|nr:BZ3501_MvSof-1269-A2-R1_Chr10-2g02564 [Microbotryum saponariae]SDA01862.1 BZ3500_MvSof-1268-A1-R1_Chr10-2g02978 [Microbotryum saponariae]